MNDINFNFAECVKSYEGIGSTHYVNICNGSQSTVPWGVGIWCGVILSVLVAVFIGFVVYKMYQIMK